MYGGLFGTTPLYNVTLTLTWTDAGGNTLSRTATTDIYGYYTFGELAAGTYSITETLPNGYDFVNPTAGTIDGSGDGVVSGNAITQIQLGDNQNGVNYDFVNGVLG